MRRPPVSAEDENDGDLSPAAAVLSGYAGGLGRLGAANSRLLARAAGGAGMLGSAAALVGSSLLIRLPMYKSIVMKYL